MPIISIRDYEGNYVQDLKRINVRLSLGHAASDAAYDDKFSDDSGNLAFPVVLPSNDGYTLHFNFENINPKFTNHSLWVERPDAQNILVNLNRTSVPRATISGFYSNVFLKGESAFLDLCRLCHGQDIKPLLRQSVDLNSNGRRNFLMTWNTARAAGLGEFNPDDFPNYYDKLKELLDLYVQYGLYLYASVFPDNGFFPSWKDNKNKQVDHWNKIGTIAQQYDNFWAMELTNEMDAHWENQTDPNWFSKIPGVLSCSGSRGDTGEDPMPEPQWDYCDHHSNRTYPKSVKDPDVADHPSRLKQGKAILEGEPVGFGDPNINPRREPNPRIAKELAGSARGTTCGVIFHSENGGFSRLYDSIEMNCAKAWFKELEGA